MRLARRISCFKPSGPCNRTFLNTVTMSLSDPQYKKKESIEQRQDAEQTVNRNPHGDFSKVQASRPDFDHSSDGFHYTKTPAPSWKLGDGGNDGGASVGKKQIQIDPYEEGRPAVFNYKLMISAIVPRPIGFVSTRSKDGKRSPEMWWAEVWWC
jgi:hypothetical protein